MNQTALLVFTGLSIAGTIAAVFTASYAATVARETADAMEDFVDEFRLENAAWRNSVLEAQADDQHETDHRIAALAKALRDMERRRIAAPDQYGEGWDDYLAG